MGRFGYLDGNGIQLSGALVDFFAQGLARLEMGNALFRNGNAFTAAGVPADTRWAAVDREAAETTDFNAMATFQGVAHGIQNGLDRKLCIAVRQLGKARRQLFYKV